MKIAKGETVNFDDQDVVLTKVSRKGMQGILDGSKKVGDSGAFTPVFRLYFKRPNKTQGHADVAINPKEIDVVCG